MDVLGVRVNNLSKNEILEKVNNFLSEDRFHQIATVNPEFILAAEKDRVFKNILNNCDLNVADGIGLKFAFWRSGEKLNFRIAGADLMEEILRLAEKNNFKIFLAASSRGLSTWEETRDAILKKYPILEIGGANLDRNIKSYQMPDARYDILFCNFGAPFQEIFLNSLKTAKNSRIRVAMGVGGSFDYLTGKITRAPVFMRKNGLEWLWRLIRQPWRIKRIWSAVIIFPIKIFFQKKNEQN